MFQLAQISALAPSALAKACVHSKKRSNELVHESTRLTYLEKNVVMRAENGTFFKIPDQKSLKFSPLAPRESSLA